MDLKFEALARDEMQMKMFPLTWKITLAARLNGIESLASYAISG
jgi:hypothetical protein